MQRTVMAVGHMKYILRDDRKLHRSEVEHETAFKTKGLKTLTKTNTFKIKKVIDTGDSRTYTITPTGFKYV
jgi:fructosamine-3-kinase